MSITLDGTTGIVAPAIDVATPITVSDGGTGLSALGTANQVLAVNAGATALEFQTVAGGVTSLNGQSGAITNTDQYAIGSYVTGRPQNFTNYTNNTTIAGSSLFATSLNNGNFIVGSGPSFATGANASLITTGTWRCLGAARGNESTVGYAGLWVRIS